MRTGFGLDVHALDGEPPLILCGVVVSDDVGLSGTSDADVAAHAVADAILGAAALGDVGTHFPSSDPAMSGADSMELLARVVAMITSAGFTVGNVDVTVAAQAVRIGPHRQEMRERLAGTLGVDIGAVSVKATTTDGLGFIGRNEGIAAHAVATVRYPSE